MKVHRLHTKGFTLIELLLGVAASGIILLAALALLGILQQARVKQETISEIESNGTRALATITAVIRSATSVTAPLPGTTASTLTLVRPVATTTPTTINLSADVIQITEGAQNSLPLTSDRVSVSNLLFSNFSQAGTPGSVRVDFTLNAVNPSNRPEYTYAQRFTASATLRR